MTYRFVSSQAEFMASRLLVDTFSRQREDCFYVIIAGVSYKEFKVLLCRKPVVGGIRYVVDNNYSYFDQDHYEKPKYKIGLHLMPRRSALYSLMTAEEQAAFASAALQDFEFCYMDGVPEGLEARFNQTARKLILSERTAALVQANLPVAFQVNSKHKELVMKSLDMFNKDLFGRSSDMSLDEA